MYLTWELPTCYSISHLEIQQSSEHNPKELHVVSVCVLWGQDRELGLSSLNLLSTKLIAQQPAKCVPRRTRHCCCCCYPGPRSYSSSSSACGTRPTTGAAPQGFIEPWTTHSQSTLSALCPGPRKETSLRQSQPGSQSLWGSCPFPAHLTAPARNHALLSLPRP